MTYISNSKNIKCLYICANGKGYLLMSGLAFVVDFLVFSAVRIGASFNQFFVAVNINMEVFVKL